MKNGEWKVFVFPTCGARIKKKMTGFAGCFDTRKRFYVPVMARKYRALDVSAAKSRCILPRLGAQSASNRNQTTKAPSPDEAFYFQISINSLFPAEYFPLLFYPVHGISCFFHFPFSITDFAVCTGCSGIFPAVQCDCPKNVPLFISLGINSLLPFY